MNRGGLAAFRRVPHTTHTCEQRNDARVRGGANKEGPRVMFSAMSLLNKGANNVISAPQVLHLSPHCSLLFVRCRGGNERD